MQKEIHVSRTRKKTTESQSSKSVSEEVVKLANEYKKANAESKAAASKERKARKALYNAMTEEGVKEVPEVAKIFSKEGTEVDVKSYLSLFGKENSKGQIVINPEKIDDLASSLTVGVTNARKVTSENALAKISKQVLKSEDVHLS